MNAPVLIRKPIPRGPRGAQGPWNDPLIIGPIVKFRGPDGTYSDPSYWVNTLGPEGPSGDAQYFSTRSQAIAHNITTGLPAIKTYGYHTPGDGGGATYKLVTTGEDFTSADGQKWALAEPIITPLMTGAYGDGTTDDTTAMQLAITKAQLLGSTMFIPALRYKTSSPLLVTDRITILGCGYQDDSAGGYQGHGLTLTPANLRGSIFLPGTHDCFQITCDAAVHFEKFQISYALGASSGTGATGIKGTSTSGSTAANTRSVFRDLCITSGDYAMQLTNFLEYHIDNVNMLYHWHRGLVSRSIHYPHYGDSIIQNCTLWGGSVTNDAHIAIHSGGGHRILNNKINTGGPGISSAILIQPDLSVAQQIEPLLIQGNSIEGTTNGITFNNANALASCTQSVINGNQIWVGSNPIIVNDNFGSAWVSGLTVTGNVFTANGGGVGVPILAIAGMSYGNIGNNMFGLAFGGTGNAVAYGTNASENDQRNSIGVPGVVLDSVSTPAVPASTAGIFNTYHYPVEVHITGGTGTVINRSGVVIHSQSAAGFNHCVILQRGEYIALTYSVAPTWSWRALNP